MKRLVGERAGERCEYCRSPAWFVPHPFSIEHVIPRSRGGEGTADNLALSCQGCNNHKYDKVEARDPATGTVITLYHPRRDRFRDHFAWNDDFTLIVGISPTGRATVAALHLNRDLLVSLRRRLVKLGEHPPAEG
jgi:hypothetical protein